MTNLPSDYSDVMCVYGDREPATGGCVEEKEWLFGFKQIIWYSPPLCNQHLIPYAADERHNGRNVREITPLVAFFELAPGALEAHRDRRTAEIRRRYQEKERR